MLGTHEKRYFDWNHFCKQSEYLYQSLKDLGIQAKILNAHLEIVEGGADICQAGRLRAVTVATNMAGRGTDIILGEIARSCQSSQKLSAIMICQNWYPQVS